MSVEIPKISNPYCVGMTACGVFTNDNDEFLKKIKRLSKEKGELVADHAKGKTSMFVRLKWGGSDSKHMHIDVYRKKALGHAMPEVNATVEEIQEQLNPVVGEEARETIAGRFKIPVKKLSRNGIIASSSFATSKGKLSIRMTAGELTIQGAPVQSLIWKLDEKMENLFIELSSRATFRITDGYLVEIYQVFDSAFNVLVLGDGNNARE